MKNNRIALFFAGLIFFWLIIPSTAYAGVTHIKGYSKPDGGQDKFVFDVYVSSSEDYPACSVIAEYTDGSPSYTTRGMPTFSMNINPSKPSTINIDCEGVKASVLFQGNTYPFAGDIYKKVGAAPTKAPTKNPTTVITRPPAVPITPTSIPITDNSTTLVIDPDFPVWIQNITFLPLRNFLEYIFRFFSK